MLATNLFALSDTFSFDGFSDHAGWNEGFHNWDRKFSCKGKKNAILLFMILCRKLGLGASGKGWQSWSNLTISLSQIGLQVQCLTGIENKIIMIITNTLNDHF